MKVQISTGKIFGEVFATVDPGLDGGIAIWESGSLIRPARLLYHCEMPVTSDGKTGRIVDGAELGEMFEHYSVRHLYIEKVGSMPGNAGQKMFNFGRAYGTVIGVAEGNDILVNYVSPITWQNTAHAGLLRGQDPKARSLYICKTKFGLALKAKQDGIADAICLGIHVCSINKWEIDYGIKKKDKGNEC